MSRSARATKMVTPFEVPRSRRRRLGSVVIVLAMLAGVVALSSTSTSAAPVCDPFDPDPPPICGPIEDPDPVFEPRANGFDWLRPNRFTNTVPSYRWDQASATYAPDYVHPSTWAASFDACATADDLVASNASLPTANVYTWLIRGETIAQQSCLLTYDRFPAQGTYDVSVTITGPAAGGPFTQQVTIRDMLIVSIGDSYASGEGNPVVNKTGSNPAQWVDDRCHRSTTAGPAMSAAAIERSDPHTSVTFLSFACSGATIARPYHVSDDAFDFYASDWNKPLGVGVLAPYRGAEPANPDDYDTRNFLPSQIDQLMTAVTCTEGSPGCGNGARRIDALLVSGGGNDIGFGPVAASCVFHQDCSGNATVSHWPPNLGQITLSTRFAHDASLMPGIYSSLADRLDETGLAIAQTYITEYPDPTTTNDPNDADGSCDRMLEDTNPIPFVEISDVETRWARDVVLARLNAEVLAGAQVNGWTHVGGISSAFTGHGYCAPDGQRWIRRAAESVTRQGPDNAADTKGTLHPTFEGHRVYAERLVAVLAPDLDALPIDGPDDAAAEVIVSKADLSLVESGATDAFTIVLGSEPTADVVVTPSASGLCTVSGPLTFTAANWATPRTVTVTPGNDDVVHAQSCTITNAVTSADPAYAAVDVGSLLGPVEDDDHAEVAIVAGALVLHEATPATTATYTVVLTSEPTADVTVALTVADGQTTLDQPTVTFTAANWATPRTVTVTVVDDAVEEASPHTGVIAHQPSSSDAGYGPSATMTIDGAPGTEISVSIGDDETATALELSTPADDRTAVTATATVSGGDSPRTGTVQFAVDGADMGAPVVLDADVAVLDLGILAVGARQVTATYSGDALHDGSQDAAETVVTAVVVPPGEEETPDDEVDPPDEEATPDDESAVPVAAGPTTTSSTTPNANQAGASASASGATPKGTTTTGTASGTLPRTGSSPLLLLTLGSVLVAAGALVSGTRRRLSRVNASRSGRVR